MPIQLSDDVTKPSRGSEIGSVQDRLIANGYMYVYWLGSEETTLENPSDLEIYTYGPQWTVKDAKADAKLRGLKLRTEKGSPYKTIIR